VHSLFRNLFIRVVILGALIVHGVMVYTATGYDDFLPFRVVYAGTVVFHAVHAWQLYQYQRRAKPVAEAQVHPSSVD